MDFNIEKILSKADFNFKKHLPLEYLLGIPKFNYPLLRTVRMTSQTC